MRKLTQNIVALPVGLFFVVVLIAPELVIHHTHQIEAHADADHNGPLPGATVDVPVTYHETHVVSFLSGESFDSSPRSEIGPSHQEVIGFLATASMVSCPHPLAPIALFDIRPLSQHSGDTCALFCNFLI